MMTWLAWLVIALVLLVVVLNLWMIWHRVSDATSMPAEPTTLAEHAAKHQPQADHVPPNVLGELDERGYLSSRKFPMGCEAAICRTPFGARVVAGKCGLEEPQYAWDYTSVAQAQKALVGAMFRTDPKEGFLHVGDKFSSGFYPAAEPRNYFRRWKYTSDRQMQRF